MPEKFIKQAEYIYNLAELKDYENKNLIVNFPVSL